MLDLNVACLDFGVESSAEAEVDGFCGAVVLSAPDTAAEADVPVRFVNDATDDLRLLFEECDPTGPRDSSLDDKPSPDDSPSFFVEFSSSLLSSEICLIILCVLFF
jgi:hypothetical protein